DQLLTWDGIDVFENDDWKIPMRNLADPNTIIVMEFLKPNGEVYQVESPGGRVGTSTRGYKHN
ncbi:MAG: hypothetical protein VX252_16355, partial [Myxococcota bacterium]|nr:hypothetical protein [Myxococcota bacterium]